MGKACLYGWALKTIKILHNLDILIPVPVPILSQHYCDYYYYCVIGSPMYKYGSGWKVGTIMCCLLFLKCTAWLKPFLNSSFEHLKC